MTTSWYEGQELVNWWIECYIEADKMCGPWLIIKRDGWRVVA